MKNSIRFMAAVLLWAAAIASVYAADYTTYLTVARGFTEVTSTDAILGDADYYYLLAPAETDELIVGVGRYEGKPDWASTDSKALRYHSAATDPVLDLSNFFTIEKSGQYIGLRNVVYNTDLFQTHDNAGYMYVNTYTDKTLDEWSYLTPTYQSGYWLFESGKYPISSGDWACGYLGPWNKSVADGEPIALNRLNETGDDAGHYRLFRIAKDDLMALHLYASILTPENGFTEVITTDGMLADDQYCYLITAAETNSLYVGVGKYELKPDWAGEDTKALRYRPAEINPLLDLSNFFTIEKSGEYIGLRNLYYYTSLFQTHNNAGYMYVLTYTEPTMSDWCYLKPTYQNGYWMFENGKYPMSSDAEWKGYMGSWTAGRMAVGEPIALNRTNTGGDVAGHYRLFRIAKTDLVAKRNQLLQAVSNIAPLNATRRITNASFETGDETGWTLIGKEDGNIEFKTRDYGMTYKDGNYLMNAYQWWASSLSVKQTVSDVPSGNYDLSGVVASWEGRTVTFSGNGTTVSGIGVNDATGVPVSMNINIGSKRQLTITAGSTTDWWTEGRTLTYNDTQCFFKLDDVRLRCKSVFLDAMALPLYKNTTTKLIPNQWYFYDVDYSSEYVLIGNLDGLVYSTDEGKALAEVTTASASRNMTLAVGHVYFKTTSSNATLCITPARTLQEGTFTAVALNVDGLPKKVATYELNPDGPGEDGTKKISQYLASKGYDFIGCSEDFNYNGALMESLKDNYSCGTIRSTLSVSGVFGGFPFDTDGLNLIWKKSKISATNESWTRWNSTVSTDGNQYVKKGYRHYDVQIDGGPVIDVFILHMDAGDTNATDSRESQWRQLADAINDSDHTRAKLIIGDTNSRYTREDVITNFINRLSTDFTMSDVWVEFYRDGVYPTKGMDNLTDQTDPTNYSNYEIVDKIIYINPTAANTVRLTPQAFRIEQDYTYGNVEGTNNTTPLGDHRPVVVTFKYTISGADSPLAVTLQDATDNSTAIASVTGALADVTLQGRTLYKDGSWNTLCLPFGMTAEQVSAQLAPAALKELDQDAIVNGHKTGLDGTTLYLNFKGAESITAGTPYIIKWESGSNITDPVFTAVTVSGGSAGSVESEDGTVTFQGTYDPVPLTKGDKSNLYLGDSNTLYWPDADNFKVNAFRAYFHLSDPSLARQVILNFGDFTTGVSVPSLNTLDSQPIYDLQGRRIDGQLNRGLYIRNGRKILVK
ncbi:MAG: hypothetical protein J6Z14_08435 [Prevotella sp.]|nr:hypothetical protein [Prevotella sp.]